MTGRTTRSAAVVLAVTIQRLVEDATRFWSVEEQLVLGALRRSSNELTNAPVTELREYVMALEPDALRGVLSNVKGIYHELLYAHAENVDGDEVTAQLFDASNRPGADVEFYVDDQSIGVLQLKSVESPDYVKEHMAQYPDIDVQATEEVANTSPDIESSGFTNATLTDTVEDTTNDLDGDGLVTEGLEGVATSSLVAAAFTARQALREGSVSNIHLKSVLGDVATGGVASIVLDIVVGDIV